MLGCSVPPPEGAASHDEAVPEARSAGNYATEVVNDLSISSVKAALPILSTSPLHNILFIMASLSLQSTYKLVSGYEIPVVGFGVSSPKFAVSMLHQAPV